MRYRYLDDFRRGISVFAIFSYGIAVLGTPQCPPLWRLMQVEVVNDSGPKLPKVPRRIARVFINIIVFTSWR